MHRPLYTRTEPALLPTFPRVVLATLIELGHSEAEIFQDLPLTAAQLSDERYRLTIEQHEQFILRALALTQDPHLALRMSARQSAQTTNFALLAVANSGQITKALYLIARYFKIITRVFSIRDFVTTPQAAMALDVHLQHERVIYFAISAFALFLDDFFQEPLGGAHLVRRLELPIEAPQGMATVLDQFPFEMAFAQRDTRVLFDEAKLSHPLKQADPQTVRLLLEMSERLLDDAEAELTLTGAVKALLIEQIAAPPKLPDAARQLGLSSRSLRRKLAASSTSYQQLLDGIRATMAHRLLRETHTPIASIAEALGFGSASDFARAFKRWTGRPPSSLRQD
ncbi:MAG: helix-turn-helix domain-containing protein [Pseudomonadota bacterium]